MGTSRWRYPRTSPECPPRTSLDKRFGKNHEYSPDLPVRRPVRLPKHPRHRDGRVEDRPTDSRRVEVHRIVEDRPTDPQIIEVLAPTGYLPRLNLAEEILLDRIKERLHLRRGGQDEVYQPLGGKPLTTRIRISQLLMGWMTPEFSRFDGKGDPDQHQIEYRTLMAPNDSDDQLARVLKQSLKGQALSWYVRLRKNSINSFEALAQEFSRQYAYNRTQLKRIDAHINLNIGPKESLKDFITRFIEEASEVVGADRNKGIICTAFKNALLDTT